MFCILIEEDTNLGKILLLKFVGSESPLELSFCLSKLVRTATIQKKKTLARRWSVGDGLKFLAERKMNAKQFIDSLPGLNRPIVSLNYLLASLLHFSHRK